MNTAPRLTPRRENRLISVPAAANTHIFGGTMVSMLTNGTGAVPTSTASSGRAIGVANETVDNNPGTAGERRVTVERSCFRFANSTAGDLITLAHIGLIAYAVDDGRVALTSSSGTRQIAGGIVDVDAEGVWVDIGPGAVGPQGPQGEPG